LYPLRTVDTVPRAYELLGAYESKKNEILKERNLLFYWKIKNNTKLNLKLALKQIT